MPQETDCSSQAPLISKRKNGSMYICTEWCVYVCGFRDSYVNVPLAKRLQQKYYCQWWQFYTTEVANAKIKVFVFSFWRASIPYF